MTRPSPAQVVLNRHFREFAEEEYSGRDLDEVFEIYVAGQLLKQRNLNDEELNYGLVDGSDDGGIDAFYTFLNGTLVQLDHPALEPGYARRNGDQPLIDVVVLQSKNSESWSETAWEKMNSSLSALLDNARPLDELEPLFRPAVLEQVGIYRQLAENLATRFPQTSFTVQYVTRAPAANIAPRLTEKADQLQRLIESYLTPGSKVTVEHVGVERLYEIAGTSHSAPGTLRFRNIIREQDSYIGVASIDDYLSFVRDEKGELREDLFESNVRDYEGDNTVNRSIRETLREDDGTEFWWQNNGVTVLGRRVEAPQLTLTIDQPLVVNGLQTTHVLDAAQRSGTMNERRREQGILVRVIVAAEEGIRDKVIGGTNRQTRVPSPALFASDELQRDIERFFLAHDWYYERRKNQYKNQGKPASRRVSINLLAQTTISLLLGHPDDARARPSTILTREGGYEAVFPPTVSKEAYLRAVQLLSRVSEFLRTPAAKAILNDYSNTRFYMLVGAAMKAVGASDFSALHFAQNSRRVPESMPDQDLMPVMMRLRELVEFYEESHPDATRDAIFKNAEFRAFYLRNIATKGAPVLEAPGNDPQEDPA